MCTWSGTFQEFRVRHRFITYLRLCSQGFVLFFHQKQVDICMTTKVEDDCRHGKCPIFRMCSNTRGAYTHSQRHNAQPPRDPCICLPSRGIWQVFIYCTIIRCLQLVYNDKLALDKIKSMFKTLSIIGLWKIIYFQNDWVITNILQNSEPLESYSARCKERNARFPSLRTRFAVHYIIK